MLYIGTGYVGLPTGACFADLGNDVVCVDTNLEKIESLNRGTISLYEPGLAEIVQRNRRAKRLHFTTDLLSAVSNADIIILAVGTPADFATGHADLRFINAALSELAKVLKPEDGYTVIAIKSTVPVGTNDRLAVMLAVQNPHIQFDLVSIPEFLREGQAMHDFLHPDRIVVGVENARAKAVLEELYVPFAAKNIPIVYCNRKSAEMIKYAANAFLGIKISYTNELADLCEQLGANIRDVTQGVGLDSRIGAKFLKPGPGFGGSCFPKDMLEFVTSAKEAGIKFSTVQAAVDYNLQRGTMMVNKIQGFSVLLYPIKSLLSWDSPIRQKPMTSECPLLFLLLSSCCTRQRKYKLMIPKRCKICRLCFLILSMHQMPMTLPGMLMSW